LLLENSFPLKKKKKKKKKGATLACLFNNSEILSGCFLTETCIRVTLERKLKTSTLEKKKKVRLQFIYQPLLRNIAEAEEIALKGSLGGNLIHTSSPGQD